jgi:hypothetical protein
MKLLTRTTLPLLAILLISPSTFARLKIDTSKLNQIESVALVGYSFFRDVEMEPPSLSNLKPKAVQLSPYDPEYKMMQEAAERIVEKLQKVQPFELVSKETVFANEQYQSLSKDPKKRWALNWYFPGEYRDMKKDKKNAVALAEALDVDAVLWIHVKHGRSSKSSGGFGKSKKNNFINLKGELTLFDRAGKQLISGSVKSKKLLKSSSQSFGAGDGVEIELADGSTRADELWFPLLESYLANLEMELAK